MILSGKNPIVIADKRFSEQGGYKVIEDTVDLMIPSAERRDAAMRALLDRRDGLPAQRVQLEAEIRSTQTHAVVGVPELAHLPPRVLGAVVTALRGAMTALPAPVIDVSSEPVPGLASPADQVIEVPAAAGAEQGESQDGVAS